MKKISNNYLAIDIYLDYTEYTIFKEIQMLKLSVSKEFRDLIFPLSDEEFHLLEQSILESRIVRDPIVVWQNGKPNPVILDGHHRKRIIDKHKIKNYKILKLKFDNKDEAKKFMIENQLGKRNASPESISYLRGLRYKLEKKTHGGDRKSKLQKADLKPTSELLANKFKVNRSTIERDEKYTDAIDTICSKFDRREQQNIKNKLLSRQTSLTKKDIIDICESDLGIRSIKQIVSGQKELWQVRLELEKKRKNKKKKLPKVILPKDIKVHHGDALKILPTLKRNSVDSALVDGPYGIGIMGKEWDNFTPAQIDRYNLIEQAYFVGDRSPALKAGLYDQSYEGGKKYQKWCEKWGKQLIRVMKPGGHLLSFCSPRMYARMVCGLEDAGWHTRSAMAHIFGTGFPMSMSVSPHIDKLYGTKSKTLCENPNRKNRLNWNKNEKNIISPVSVEAEQWEGWFTHLKNSLDLIVLARKPMSEKTVAENLVKWGTGALNAQACRIGEDEDSRFASNALFEEEAGKEINQQAGQNVSQYFYCAKPTLKERNFGCEDLPAKKQNSSGNIRTYNDRCNNCGKKFIGPKSRICQCPIGKKVTNKEVYTNPNNHPTIKSLTLCRYLARLITPPRGIMCDPFMGSGTSGMAAAHEGFRFVGIEKQKEYYTIARRRIMAAYREANKRSK